MSIARWGRRVSVGVNSPPKWRGQTEAERAVMHRASGMSAGTAETAQQAQGEARQPDPDRGTPND